MQLPHALDQILRSCSLVVVALFTFICLGPSEFQQSAVAILLVLISWLIVPKFYVELFRRTWIVWLLFAVIMVIGYLGSVIPAKSLKGCWELFRSAFIFFAAVSLLNRRTDTDIFKGFMIAAWLVTVFLMMLYFWSIYQGNSGWSLRDNIVLSGLISGIHEFANVAAMALIAVVATYISAPAYQKSRTLVLIALLVFLLVVSDSLGAYLALAFCVVYAFGWRNRLFFYLFGIATVILMVVSIWVSFYLVGTEVLGLELPWSFSERIVLYKGTWSAFLDRPWFGYGLNSFKFDPDLIGGGLNQVMPHNIFLEALFSVGIMGSAFFLVAFTLLMRGGITSGGSQSSTLWERCGQLMLVYVLFRGLSELHLGFKVYSALFVASALIWLGRLVEQHRAINDSHRG